MKRLYLAGPMTGHAHFNFPKFDNFAARLRKSGYEVCNPAEHDREKFGDAIEKSLDGSVAHLKKIGFSLRDALAYDLSYICREADGVAVMVGWEKSKGARAEVATAYALGVPVKYVWQWLGEAL